MLLTTTVIAVLIYHKRVKYFLSHRNFSAIVLFAAVMFLLPFAGAVGTGNYLYIGTLWDMAPWFGLLLILLVALTGLLKNRWNLLVGILIISSFSCAQILSGCWYQPYRLNKGLSGQTQATEIGYPTTILKLDPATSEFFYKIRQLASKNGFKPGDDVLGFSNLPGVVFAGGRSPGIPWYNCGYEGSRAFAEKALSLVPQERLKRAIILQTSGSAKCMPDLAKFGINFPGDYILCGQLIIPFLGPKIPCSFEKAEIFMNAGQGKD